MNKLSPALVAKHSPVVRKKTKFDFFEARKDETKRKNGPITARIGSFMVC